MVMALTKSRVESGASLESPKLEVLGDEACLRVIVIEDDRRWRNELCRLLNELRCEVYAFDRAETALLCTNLLEGDDVPWMVLSNEQLPGLSGRQLIRRLSQLSEVGEPTLLSYSPDLFQDLAELLGRVQRRVQALLDEGPSTESPAA